MSLLRRVLGTVLRRVRLRQGRTLREVAEAAGVSVPYLSEIERGRKEASSEILAAICQALGMHLADLLEAARDELRRLEPRRVPAEPRLLLRSTGTHLPPRVVAGPGGSAGGRSAQRRKTAVFLHRCRTLDGPAPGVLPPPTGRPKGGNHDRVRHPDAGRRPAVLR